MTPMPVVVMKIWSPLPRLTTFVSPVTNCTPASRGGGAHRLDHAAQVLDGQALFENERRGEIERARSAHGEIVHRAVDGEAADVAAGKEDRRDHEGVCGEGQARAADRRGPPGRPACRGLGLLNAGRKILSMSSAVSLPPLPWPSTMCLCSKMGIGQEPNSGDAAASIAPECCSAWPRSCLFVDRAGHAFRKLLMHRPAPCCMLHEGGGDLL